MCSFLCSHASCHNPNAEGPVRRRKNRGSLRPVQHVGIPQAEESSLYVLLSTGGSAGVGPTTGTLLGVIADTRRASVGTWVQSVLPVWRSATGYCAREVRRRRREGPGTFASVIMPRRVDDTGKARLRMFGGLRGYGCANPRRQDDDDSFGFLSAWCCSSVSSWTSLASGHTKARGGTK